MIYNSLTLLRDAPIKDMLTEKASANGVTHGLTEAGYDIRIKQDVHFVPRGNGANRGMTVTVNDPGRSTFGPKAGRFALASAIEEFQMPTTLVGVVHDKSTWARRGLSVFNTVIEPGWCGFLTLELVYHGTEELLIPAGSGIAQVLFHNVVTAASYQGRYQNQADQPVAAIEHA